MNAMIRGLAMACALGALIFALAVFAETPPRPAQRVDLAAAGWSVGGIDLLDQHGGRFIQAGLAGRWSLLVAGDSGCNVPGQ